MEQTQQLAAPEQKILTTKDLLNREDVQKRFKEMLGVKAQGFIVSVLQLVASNDLLKDADPMSVYNAAAVAATLDLPLNNNLGFAYIIPYKQNYTDPQTGQQRTKVVAQFQMGYKGFIQLSQRSGQFKTISAAPIYEGQLIEENPLTGFLFDFTKKSDKIIGYASYFKLINGFEKVLYMPAETVVNHGKRFSKSFSKGYGLWKDDFDSMAIKTVIKLLLSKYAPLSIEMQKAVITDQAIINDAETEDVTYVDNLPEPKEELTQVQIEMGRRFTMIQTCETLADLDLLVTNNPDFDADLIAARRKELTPVDGKQLQAKLTLQAKERAYEDMDEAERASDKGLMLAHEIDTLKGEVK